MRASLAAESGAGASGSEVLAGAVFLDDDDTVDTVGGAGGGGLVATSSDNCGNMPVLITPTETQLSISTSETGSEIQNSNLLSVVISVTSIWFLFAKRIQPFVRF